MPEGPAAPEGRGLLRRRELGVPSLPRRTEEAGPAPPAEGSPVLETWPSGFTVRDSQNQGVR